MNTATAGVGKGNGFHPLLRPRERARRLVTVSTYALLDRLEALYRVVRSPSVDLKTDWRTSSVAKHVDQILDVIDMVIRRELGRAHPGYMSHRAHDTPLWQRVRVSAPDLPYSGQTFWVRGKPVLLDGDCLDVWTGVVSTIDDETRYLESNLMHNGRRVYALASVCEFQGGVDSLRRQCFIRTLRPFAGRLPPDTHRETDIAELRGSR